MARHRLIAVAATALAFAVAWCAAGTPASAQAWTDTPHHFGFKKSRNGQPASIDQEPFRPLVDKHGALFLGDADAKALYLTFDNGYENGFTPQILDVLKEKRVPAIFFVTGQYIKEQPELLRRMVDEGHLIGNHSWSHPDLTTVSDAKLKEELDQVKAGVAAVTKQKDMLFLRPPRGIFSDRTLAVSKQLGYVNVFWSVAYVDWDTKRQRGADYAFRQVTAQLHPGAILLLHSVSKDNADAMGRIIDYAREQGYEFRSLESLLLPTP
ncbi:delta-lactam-biosynthetic de-N-acetylase [Paenibacillus sp.]|uniref:delta-lactam-biosynthetic de-N-acetylase n=1 Tax=Paenibacillus sp. TaxID=58172 RepID=UPI002D59A5CD|nr:delta-lactam-biosynthetic de-N-acetylase [Paenibacillus sp.]HZG57829.1 delta-lactam-biosynthetic de-N-acetylase [Paenibacillus sp.]